MNLTLKSLDSITGHSCHTFTGMVGDYLSGRLWILGGIGCAYTAVLHGGEMAQVTGFGMNLKLRRSRNERQRERFTN